MLDKLITRLLESDPDPDKYTGLFTETTVAPKTSLVQEGDIIKSIYFVKKGCLRLWFNNNGNDITYQFFFENQPVQDSWMRKRVCLHWKA